MTDRHSGYIVILEDDVREDDAEATLQAIRQVKRVIDVRPIVSDTMQEIATSRAKWEIRNKIDQIFKDT